MRNAMSYICKKNLKEEMGTGVRPQSLKCTHEASSWMRAIQQQTSVHCVADLQQDILVKQKELLLTSK